MEDLTDGMTSPCFQAVSDVMEDLTDGMTSPCFQAVSDVMEDVLDAALGRPRSLLTNGSSGAKTGSSSSAGVRLSM